MTKKIPYSQKKIEGFSDWLALYHFALQVTVMERLSLNCVDNVLGDRQLDRLCRWQEQCQGSRIILQTHVNITNRFIIRSNTYTLYSFRRKHYGSYHDHTEKTA